MNTKILALFFSIVAVGMIKADISFKNDTKKIITIVLERDGSDKYDIFPNLDPTKISNTEFAYIAGGKSTKKLVAIIIFSGTAKENNLLTLSFEKDKLSFGGKRIGIPEKGSYIIKKEKGKFVLYASPESKQKHRTEGTTMYHKVIEHDDGSFEFEEKASLIIAKTPQSTTSKK